jgi:hypothetical protein
LPAPPAPPACAARAAAAVALLAPALLTLPALPRSYNYGARQRIWDAGGTLNWLSGFYGSLTSVTSKGAGVVYHNNFMGNPAGSTVAPFRAWNFDWGGFDWMLTSDQWDLFRSDRVREFYTGGAWSEPLIITLNDGYNGVLGSEYSDWAVAVALIYNCTLTASQMQQVRELAAAAAPGLAGQQQSLHMRGLQGH